MLVFSHKTGEDMVIDGVITLRVLPVEGNKIRIRIDAPASVSVDRREVHDRRAEFAAELKRRARRVPVEQRRLSC
jgi:carbon storage regulator CsrA